MGELPFMDVIVDGGSVHMTSLVSHIFAGDTKEGLVKEDGTLVPILSVMEDIDDESPYTDPDAYCTVSTNYS
jgi:hypothetical protein